MHCTERNGSDEVFIVTGFFNPECLRVGGILNKISSDRAFVTRDVRTIVLSTV